MKFNITSSILVGMVVPFFGACQLTPSSKKKTAAALPQVMVAMNPAESLCSAVNRMRGYDGPGDTIPPEYWPSEVKSLHPIRVSRELLNTRIVQGVKDNVEFGKYIMPTISSYTPIQDEGFTLMTATGLGESTASVYDYTWNPQPSR
jgi:hypothetical protein